MPAFGRRRDKIYPVEQAANFEIRSVEIVSLTKTCKA